MSGIYIHVPFCKTRCIYCDFYSSTHEEKKEEYVAALSDELTTRSGYLPGKEIGTIYLGGGTPSQLSARELERILDVIYRNYQVSGDAEITLEANPDDLSPSYLQALRGLPVNRLSIGIQTFDDTLLRKLHRRHSATQAIEALYNCREYGFGNISIDLMYGLPGQDLTIWQQDLRQALLLRPEHLSAYYLTYEEGTPLYRMLEKGKVREEQEEISLQYFSRLMEQTEAAGYEHYEISNFALPGYHSRHNSSYWEEVPYLGCGPSAHSFNGRSREWNVSSLTDYIKGWKTGKRLFETEPRSLATSYNEYILTRLRTRAGIPTDAIRQRYGEGYERYFRDQIQPYIQQEAVVLSQGHIRLTRRGIFISDTIMRDLLYIDEE
ncbi:MAG: radical SAM family heme chaperone HemW [Bacteroides sp.]|nr:radical SAM family heme chaperone HemW [Bacteroides sp.]